LKSETKDKRLLKTLQLKTTKFLKTRNLGPKNVVLIRKKTVYILRNLHLILESGMYHTCWRLNDEKFNDNNHDALTFL